MRCEVAYPGGPTHLPRAKSARLSGCSIVRLNAPEDGKATRDPPPTANDTTLQPSSPSGPSVPSTLRLRVTSAPPQKTSDEPLPAASSSSVGEPKSSPSVFPPPPVPKPPDEEEEEEEDEDEEEEGSGETDRVVSPPEAAEARCPSSPGAGAYVCTSRTGRREMCLCTSASNTGSPWALKINADPTAPPPAAVAVAAPVAPLLLPVAVAEALVGAPWLLAVVAETVDAVSLSPLGRPSPPPGGSAGVMLLRHAAASSRRQLPSTASALSSKACACVMCAGPQCCERGGG